MKRETNILVANAKQYLTALALTLFVGTVNSQTYTLTYTGNSQTLTLPQAGKWGIEMWGANGGSIVAVGGAGQGGYAKGEINVSSSGTPIYIYVGGAGQAS